MGVSWTWDGTTPKGRRRDQEGAGFRSGRGVVTLDDREPARLVGHPYIIGDFTGILSSVRHGHVGQSEHLHIGAVNARALGNHACKHTHVNRLDAHTHTHTHTHTDSM